jgi:CRP-like cAMP-binding protein
MYFINSGTVTVSTKDGSEATRSQGDFFGEGALLHSKKIRSASIKCRTPVHAIQISREYFEKYMATSESELFLAVLEKDKIRKRNRAKAILMMQDNLKEKFLEKGELLYKCRTPGDLVFILDSGKLDVIVKEKQVFSVTAGNICGEHSVMTGRPRNTTAVCVSDEGCKVFEMQGKDFRNLMEVSEHVKDSFLDLCRRRDFKKAVVFRLRKQFPYHNPREAFDAVDSEGRGVLNAKSIGNLMRELDEDFTDAEITDIIKTLNLTGSGTVSFDEFQKVFVANIRTSGSI